MKPGVPITSDAAMSRLAVLPSTLARLVREEQRVELARIPHHGLTGGEAGTRDEDHDLQVLPLTERLCQRCLWRPCLFLHLLEAGDSFIDKRIHTEIASRKIETRNGIRQPQSSNSLPVNSRVSRITISDRKSQA